ncbi:hypothetical protein DEU56DRAFT_914023 [Suillus clintonianus]|uniref:uncharacterized protein n=1 Tax=Suillus clintonianus TaxID=1904413 RepID=UPI001B87464E|nr:uncharacterized protein DEU56DRAFT_914023 [Suillus clintonianus]KAG2132997.1 hypothetical protein DEU56DRAFT_914023 [Suillus clintonianus]
MSLTSDESTYYFDVIIVGGGVAGCATALALFRTNPGASILILDDANSSVFKIGESLPAAAKPILASLSPQLLDELSKDRTDSVQIKCTGNASAWATSELEETYAMMNPFGMGWHLDRASFDQILRDTVDTICPGSVSLVKSTFIGIDKVDDNNYWSISVKMASDDRKVYHSKWVVDASGRKSSVARKLGSRIVKEDALLAFYAVFVPPLTTEDRDYRTLIEASESGWWYSSPLPNNRRVVAYHTDDTDPTSRDARKHDGFMNLLHATQHISRLISEGEYDILFDTDSRYPICTAAGSSRLEPPCNISKRADGPGRSGCTGSSPPGLQIRACAQMNQP